MVPVVVFVLRNAVICAPARIVSVVGQTALVAAIEVSADKVSNRQRKVIPHVDLVPLLTTLANQLILNRLASPRPASIWQKKSSKSSATNQRASLEKARKAEDKRYKQRIASLKKQRAAKDKEYKAKLKQLDKIGAYKPKAPTLTKHRKTTINKRLREFSEFLNVDKFFFIPLKGPAKTKRKVSRMAKDRNMKATSKGIFFEKGGHKTAKIKKTRGKAGGYAIELDGWEKKAPSGRTSKKKKELIPLEPLDKLTRQDRRLDKMAKSLGPLGKGEQYAFVIVNVDYNGYSHQVFSNTEDLINKLKGYVDNQTPEQQAKFMRMVRIVKTTSEVWFKEHPPSDYRNRKRKSRAKGARKPRN